MSDDPDHQLDPWFKPTRDNIVRSWALFFDVFLKLVTLQLNQIDLLVEGAKSGDRFFFHCTYLDSEKFPDVFTHVLS